MTSRVLEGGEPGDHPRLPDFGERGRIIRIFVCRNEEGVVPDIAIDVGCRYALIDGPRRESIHAICRGRLFFRPANGPMAFGTTVGSGVFL